MKKATQAEYDSLRNNYSELRSLASSYEREIQELKNIILELKLKGIVSETSKKVTRTNFDGNEMHWIRQAYLKLTSSGRIPNIDCPILEHHEIDLVEKVALEMKEEYMGKYEEMMQRLIKENL